MDDFIFNIHDRPGLTYSQAEKEKLVNELRTLGKICLHPLPSYQVFANSSTALDDKIIVTAHASRKNGPADTKGELLAFTSALIFNIPGIEGDVLHTGLTVISPSARRQGLLVPLYMHLLLHIYSEKEPTERTWITSLAEVPNSLVHISTFMAEVYPSPSSVGPSDKHLLIARAIDRHHRDKMLISPTAIFDIDRFVFLGSNDTEQGRAFMKDVDDPHYWHRKKEDNDWYRRLFRKLKGDEVLQVGYIDGNHIEKQIALLLGRRRISKEAVPRL